MTALDGWENFYIIVGPSAGALIGLQFVVVTLVAERPIAATNPEAVNAYSTPGVIHFGAVLLLSALICMPWGGIGAISIVWGLMGFGGMIYTLIVGKRMRAQTVYKPVFEDWLFHVLLPVAAYAAMGAAACLAQSHERAALFIVASSSLLLLFTGIHNAWDIATYHAFTSRRKHKQ